jgi:hypothetical protein
MTQLYQMDSKLEIPNIAPHRGYEYFDSDLSKYHRANLSYIYYAVTRYST